MRCTTVLPEALRYHIYPPWVILMLDLITFPAVVCLNMLLGSITAPRGSDPE